MDYNQHCCAHESRVGEGVSSRFAAAVIILIHSTFTNRIKKTHKTPAAPHRITKFCLECKSFAIIR